MPKDSKPKSKSSKKSSEKSIKSSKSISRKSLKSKSQEKDIDENEIENPTQEQLETNNLDPKNFENPINNNINNMNYNNINIFQSQSLNPQNNIQKCDGCYENDATCYCKECDKSLCNMCDNQIHIIPAFKNHIRHPLNEIQHFKKLCYHHNNILKLYCESCEEPICNDCQIIGPHNNKLHRIININDAYRNKFKKLNEVCFNYLNKRYDILTGNLNVIDMKIDELDNASNKVERQININFNSMLDLLNNERGKKIAILNFESSNIQKDLVQLDEIINFMNDTKETNE